MMEPKFGSNLIGEEAIDANEALTRTVLHKTSIIMELQRKIMTAINNAIENDSYEATIHYQNEDSIVDDWISDWLTDLGYAIFNFEDYEEEGSDDNATITVNWHKDNLEKDQEPSEEKEEEADDTSSSESTT